MLPLCHFLFVVYVRVYIVHEYVKISVCHNVCLVNETVEITLSYDNASEQWFYTGKWLCPYDRDVTSWQQR